MLTASALAAADGGAILLPRNRMYARAAKESGSGPDGYDRGADWGADG